MQCSVSRDDTVFDREPEERALGVVLKISERCNLTCSYCYFFFGGDESYKLNPPIMKSDVVGAIVAFLEDAVDRYRLSSVQISLHGGEPLLLKKPAFARLCERFRLALNDKCRLRIVLQTNGVLIDEEWVEIFARESIDVGLSFDGNQAAHDVFRLDKRGRGTYAQSRRGWNLLLEAAKAKRVRWPGVLCVVSPEHSGAQLFDHFARDLGARAINFLLPDLCYDNEVPPEFVAGCGRYLREVFDAWAAYRPQRVNVRFISEIYLPLLNDGHAAAMRQRANDVAQLVAIRSSGEISPVDKLSTVSEHYKSTGLNVRTATLAEVLNGPLWAEIRAASSAVPPGCRGCQWWNICRGGPIHTRFARDSGFDNPSIYCSALQDLFSHAAGALLAGGADREQMSRRLAGQTPSPSARDEAWRAPATLAELEA